jgi:hypothetical protein
LGHKNIAQLDSLGLEPWVISRIQNPDAPLAHRQIDRTDLLRSEPSQTRLSQLLQSVIIRDRLSQFLAGAIDWNVKAVPPGTHKGLSIVSTKEAGT